MAKPRSEDEKWYREAWHSHLPSWLLDPDTLAFVDVNEAATITYGYSKSEFLRMTVLDLSPAEDIVTHLRHFWHPDWKRQSMLETWRHQTKSGKILTIGILQRTLTLFGRTVELMSVVLKRNLDLEGNRKLACHSMSPP